VSRPRSAERSEGSLDTCRRSPKMPIRSVGIPRGNGRVHADEMELARTALSVVPRAREDVAWSAVRDALDSVAIRAAPAFDTDTNT